MWRATWPFDGSSGSPKVGLDPDLAFYDPATPGFEALGNVCTWLPGHAAPKVALEVVSPGHPTKDYATAPERYAASGTGELWVFDPQLSGPKSGGGAHRLQVWARGAGNVFEQIYAGKGPCRSPYFGAWLVTLEGGQRLRLSDDRQGRRLWPTEAEAERVAKEAAQAAFAAEHAAAEAERSAREAAEAEVARLRAELEALRRGQR